MHKLNIKKRLLAFAFAILFCISLFAEGKSFVSAAEENDSYSYTSYFSEVNDETGYVVIIDDSAGFLRDATDEEFTRLVNKLLQIAEYSNVVVSTTTSHGFSSSRDFAKDRVERFFGAGNNSVSFVIDRDLNNIYLLSQGKARWKISSSRCDMITDNTYIYATSHRDYDYYRCTYETMRQVYDVFSGSSLYSSMKIITNALIAIALAMLINYFVARITSRQKKATRQEKLKAMDATFEVANLKSKLISKTRHRSSSTDSGSGFDSGSSGGGGSSDSGSSGGGHSI